MTKDEAFSRILNFIELLQKMEFNDIIGLIKEATKKGCFEINFNIKYPKYTIPKLAELGYGMSIHEHYATTIINWGN